jgi:hypothetical protein
MSDAGIVHVSPGGPIELVLEGLTGPAKGTRASFNDGQMGSVGRSEKSALGVVKDNRMSGSHFEVAVNGARVMLRDLNSSNGTSVNAKKVKQADLKNGDVITAGESTFRVRVYTPETWPDITQAEYALRNVIHAVPGERTYAVLDAAREDRIPAFLEACDAEHHSLFEGGRSRELSMVAPYLTYVPRGSKISRLLIREGWGKNWGIYVASPANLPEVKLHLQQMLTVQGAGGQKFLHRYYDPRVLPSSLATSSVQGQHRFFGPITRFVVEDQTPGVAIEIWNSPQGAQSRQIPLPG